MTLNVALNLVGDRLGGHIKRHIKRLEQLAFQQPIRHVGDTAGGRIAVGQNDRPGHLLLADGTGFLQPQYQQEQIHAPWFDIKLQRQRGENRFAEAVQQRKFLREKILQLAAFLAA